MVTELLLQPELESIDRLIAEAFFGNAKPAIARPMWKFAEDEFRFNLGVSKGKKFKVNFMPWTRIYFEAVESGLYNRFWGMGAVQSTKTTSFLVIPAMYFLFELGWDVIIGAPTMELAQAKYKEEIEPSILESRYRDKIPKTGVGSKGGVTSYIRYEDGVYLRFMGAGGSDSQRSSYPAKVILMTELDKMDEAGKVSEETDPVNQIIARAESFGDDGLVFGECTITDEYGIVYKKVTQEGTHHKPYLRCPYCKGYIYPMRDQLVGWQDAEDVLTARKNARYLCQLCQSAWSEKDRLKALKKPIGLAGGQTISRAGRVTGKCRPTRSFSLEWNSVHSAMQSLPRISELEFDAKRDKTVDALKGVIQFRWTMPWRDEYGVHLRGDDGGIVPAVVLSKVIDLRRGIGPVDSIKRSAFIDLHLHHLDWCVIDWTAEGHGHILDYGVHNVQHIGKQKDENILVALRELRDSVLVPGWPREDSDPVGVDLCLVDSGWKAEVAYAFTIESGARFMPSKGFGSRKDQEAWRPPKQIGKGRRMGHEYYITFAPFKGRSVRLVHMHSDYWKDQVFQGFSADLGSRGGITLFHGLETDHKSFADGVTAERADEIFTPGVGTKRIWLVIRRQNHPLDEVYGCMVAADMCGVQLTMGTASPNKNRDKRAAGNAPGKNVNKIRTSY